MTTEVKIIKHIKVEFSKEEEDMLFAAMGILRDLMREMKDNKCDTVIYKDYGEEYAMSFSDIDDADNILENLIDITEIR